MTAAARTFHRSTGAILALMLLLQACAEAPVPKPPPPASAAQQCLNDLDARGVEYLAAAVPASTAACTLDNPVRVQRESVAFNQPVLMSCALADELDRFIREAAEPLAERYLGQRLARLDHMGAYSCRRETGQAGRWSEHATGRAIDVSGFVLADGQRVDVVHDWRRAGKKREFLYAVAKRACDYFSVVLTPDYDSHHYNHLHLDIGRYRLCTA